MRVAFVVSNYTSLENHCPGVCRKIEQQVTALQNAGVDVCFQGLPDTSLRKITSRIPFISDGVNWSRVDITETDALYIRKPLFFSKQFVNWIASVKLTTGIPILIEFPTYPYDSELIGRPHRIPLLAKDLIYRNKLKSYTNRIITYSEDTSIFGIQTLPVINGIDFKTTNIRCPNSTLETRSLSMLCVARFHTWHGLDRLIHGLADYVGQVDEHEVFVHLVGNGPAVNDLKRLTSKLNVDKYVMFHGLKTLEEYSSIYNKCDLAIECLGLHRKHINRSSSLKTREYLAKGIPFIYSSEIDIFQEEPVDFCLRVPADDTPIDIQQLLDFKNKLYSREPIEQLTNRIRTYAERHVSMDMTMMPVINYLKEAGKYE